MSGDMIGQPEEGPTFEAVLDNVAYNPLVYRWARRHRTSLASMFDEAFDTASKLEGNMNAFSPTAAGSALENLYNYQRKYRSLKIARPCCSEKPFIYPFCNPDC